MLDGVARLHFAKQANWHLMHFDQRVIGSMALIIHAFRSFDWTRELLFANGIWPFQSNKENSGKKQGKLKSVEAEFHLAYVPKPGYCIQEVLVDGEAC